MQHGFIVPGGDAGEIVRWGVEAEEAGWDAFFVWEGVYHLNPWVLLGAIAERTSTIKLGTMLTPLPYRRPWQLAGEVATVDRLSGGRVILSIGVAAIAAELGIRGEPDDLRLRADRMDEALDIMLPAWRGEAVDHDGPCYPGVRLPHGGPTTVQDPVALWTVGIWGRPKSMRRVLRGTGMISQIPDLTPELTAEVRAWLDAHAPEGRTLDLVAEVPVNPTKKGDATRIGELADAGLTWALESMWGLDQAKHATSVPRRIASGPPRA